MSVSMGQVDVLMFVMTLMVHFPVLAMMDTYWVVMEKVVLVNIQNKLQLTQLLFRPK